MANNFPKNISFLSHFLKTSLNSNGKHKIRKNTPKNI